MDIDLLSKMVSELVLERDEVALPGVGVFVAEDVPSTFSDKGFTINPPYRRLSFRQREGSGDTSLIDLYARSNGVDTALAGRVLTDFLAELKEVLKTRKSVIFPGLGRLRATRENHFFFVPDEELNISPDTFGLQSLSLKFRSPEQDDQQVAAIISTIREGLSGAQVATPDETTPVETDRGTTVECAMEKTPEGETAVKAEPKVQAEQKASRHLPGWVKVLIWVAVIAVVLLVLLAVLGRVAPHLVDYILYTPEQRAIIWN